MSRKPSTAIISEAVRWFNFLRAKGPSALSPAEAAEWARWAADEKHLTAFRQVEQLWEGLGHSQNLRRPTEQELQADAYDIDQPISDWLERRQQPKPSG